MWRCMLIALACAGCTNPDDILSAHGGVASVDPVEGQVVGLLRFINDQPNQDSTDPCSLATPLKETQADAEGNFGFEIFRVETRRALCFRIEAQFPSGSVAWSDPYFFGAATQLPVLHDWHASPRLDGGVLQFEPPVPWPDDLQPGGVQLTHREQLVTSDGGIAWQAEDRFLVPDASSEFPEYEYARAPLLLDELRLEDFEGTLSLSAYLDDPPPDVPFLSAGVSVTRLRAGERLALRGTRVPLSRGTECPAFGTPCPLTDGLLTDVDAGMIEEVSLKLGTPAIVSATVLRGAWVADVLIRVALTQEDGGSAGEFEATVPKGDRAAFPSEASTYVRIPDGGFVPLRLTYLVIPLDAGTPASRLTLQFPSGLARIKEVSLFGR